MIRYVTGDLLAADAQALVNTVNTVGVMGKGIALQFKKTFPHNYAVYKKAYVKGELEVGKLLVVEDKYNDKEYIIINFPTKKDWRHPSKLEYIDQGLKELVKIIRDYNIKSIAIPPLGCGNGGLNWEEVSPLMDRYLMTLEEVDVQLYQPDKGIGGLLRSQENHAPVALTDARAMLLYALYYYESEGETCSLFVANKISFFYQLMGATDFKRLKFSAERYGPYSVNVGHMLFALNGKYIHGLEQMNSGPFDSLFLDYGCLNEIRNYVRLLDREKIAHIVNLTKLMTGFQSALSLEILASVAWIRRDHPHISKEETIQAIADWTTRKRDLFKEEYINLVWDRLEAFVGCGV